MIVIFQTFNAELEIKNQSWRNFNFFAIIEETGSLVVWKYSDYFYEDIDQFKYFRLVYLLIYFVLSYVVCNIEEGDQL